MNLELIPCVLIDSTAPRRNFYNWYKGYKVQVCFTPEGIVLSYAFTIANVYDSKMASIFLRNIQDQNVLFFAADAAYDSQYIYEIARTCDIFDMNPVNPQNSGKFKGIHRRVWFHFAQTIFGKQLMKGRG